MKATRIQLAVLDYPGVFQTAVYGWKELFTIAEQFCQKQSLNVYFDTTILSTHKIAESILKNHAVLIPPVLDGQYYLSIDPCVIDWLKKQYEQGAVLCSSGAGAFFLANTGLFSKRRVATHWGLRKAMLMRHPNLEVFPGERVLNDGELITNSGPWVDLGLELIAKYISSDIVQQIGKYLLLDTAPWEKEYSKVIITKLDHGDTRIIDAQHHIQSHYPTPIKVKILADRACLSERTFIRHFTKATGHKPTDYIQRVRIQRACELLESTQQAIGVIARKVGYEDCSGFRMVFKRIVGVNPSQFRHRLRNE